MLILTEILFDISLAVSLCHASNSGAVFFRWHASIEVKGGCAESFPRALHHSQSKVSEIMRRIR